MGTVGVAPGTTTIRLPDGRVVALTDWIDDKFYGTVQFNNGRNQFLEVFAVGLSNNIPGGTRPTTEVDTNIQRTGDVGLNQDWEFLCYGWGIELTRVFRVADAADFAAFSDPPNYRTWFEFNRRVFFQYKYNTKVYTDGLLEDYPQGVGLWLTTTTSNRDIAQNGRPSPRDRIALVLPVHHKMGLTYKGRFSPQFPIAVNQPMTDGGTNADGVDVKLRDFGLIRRNVS